MTRIATTPGLYPLPDWAKTELIGLKGKQKEDLISGDEGEELVAVYDRAREDVIGWQTTTGLDRVVEGQLRWDDMLAHPLIVHDAVETGGLLRYYDNNNFYREPVVTAELSADGDVAAELDAAAELVDGALQGVLPGPTSLAELATDEHYGDADAFRAGIADFLAGEIEAFPAVETLFLLEPSLGTDPDVASPAAVASALDPLVAAADRAGIDDVVVHTYWGVPREDIYAELLEAGGVGIGLDAVTDLDSAISLVSEYGVPDAVALGLVDGQNTRIEGDEEIESTISRFYEAAGEPERTYLTTNTELFYLPVSRAEQKLALLGRAADPAEVPA